MQICDDIVTVVVVVAKLDIHEQNVGSSWCTDLLHVSAQELQFKVNFMIIFV